MDTRKAILAKVERYRATAGLTEHQFGMLVAKNHKLLNRVRSSNVTLATLDRIETFIQDNPPAAGNGTA